jgi:iron(II)-dependent oxidoreductase
MIDARQLSGDALSAALRECRQRTLAFVDDLSDAQWKPNRQSGVNPIAWELGHLAWFAEFWILRGPHYRDESGFGHAQKPPAFAGPDSLFDSARIAHAQRWTQTMPSREQLRLMLSSQLEACIATIPKTIERTIELAQTNDANATDAALYFHRLALFHEDMHGEAFCWLRAALAYPAPLGFSVPLVPLSTQLSMPRKHEYPHICTEKPLGFSFDNECPPISPALDDFEIDSAPISAGQFARFVEDNGYNKQQYWLGDAGTWRATSEVPHPQRWRRCNHGDSAGAQSWEVRWFDQWLPLTSDMVAMHLNAFEAQAYCLWAGRRLPRATEWEYAAQTQTNFIWGHSVWEWTSDAFAPYPGFLAGPYREYSAPWFFNHRELRGGAFATDERMHNPRYRNFFQPHRHDIFAGFRTVKI